MMRLIFYILSLTNGQAANLRKAFANCLSADTKLSKTQLSKIVQTGGFLGRLLGSLLKIDFSLMKNVLEPMAKSALIFSIVFLKTALFISLKMSFPKSFFASILTLVVIVFQSFP